MILSYISFFSFSISLSIATSSNATTTLIPSQIYGRIWGRPENTHYDNVAASVVRANDGSTVYELHCRTDRPAPSCTESGNVITQGPTVLAYSTTDRTRSTFVSCSRTADDANFICIGSSSVQGFRVQPQTGWTIGAGQLTYQPVLITGGVEKLPRQTGNGSGGYDDMFGGESSDGLGRGSLKPGLVVILAAIFGAILTLT